ncbi:hypothetical protein BDK51DRAFT_34203 [Blyttiomyces helicus]|uniref:Uncharacterized protein n=1 Tax=Blyttiomyces helicus TaxID=388810 RepID=A0A4P9WQZ4_9FUNG|nr:hypothetical protein BDK51DRAFT_34203 [Blyttiomyces helicus]|eukprot:RKO94825.1 hypothetical protein BDK51DRAFT_34203 [Blyttiomyces helicus]
MGDQRRQGGGGSCLSLFSSQIVRTRETEGAGDQLHCGGSGERKRQSLRSWSYTRNRRKYNRRKPYQGRRRQQLLARLVVLASGICRIVRTQIIRLTGDGKKISRGLREGEKRERGDAGRVSDEGVGGKVRGQEAQGGKAEEEGRWEMGDGRWRMKGMSLSKRCYPEILRTLPLILNPRGLNSAEVDRLIRSSKTLSVVLLGRGGGFNASVPVGYASSIFLGFVLLTRASSGPQIGVRFLGGEIRR